jgi:hypothetical protein
MVLGLPSFLIHDTISTSKFKEGELHAEEVIARLKETEEYKKYSELVDAFQNKPGRATQEEEEAIRDAVEKVDKEFIRITNSTICSILSCCRNHRKKGISLKAMRLSAITAYKKKILESCEKEMPDYWQYLERRLREIWILKNKKSKRSPRN